MLNKSIFRGLFRMSYISLTLFSLVIRISNHPDYYPLIGPLFIIAASCALPHLKAWKVKIKSKLMDQGNIQNNKNRLELYIYNFFLYIY